MKRIRGIRIHILVCLIILTGFGSFATLSYSTYSRIIRDDIKNISKLTATNIYSDLSIQLTKPIFVGLTMANDSFVDTWLKEEKAELSDKGHQKKMTDYLKGLMEKYKYNSVFLVSDFSKNYYHFKGINKVISDENQHDQWYYNFLNSNMLYDLDVDTDEANRNKLSVFINCRIESDYGKLLGVTGVGLELDKVQDLLKHYRDDFQLEAMLFDKNGVVQIHSDTELIGKINVFDYDALKVNKGEIINNKASVAVYQYKDYQSEGYMITKYIEDLDWYLLVKKDTSVLVNSFRSMLLKDSIIFLSVLFFVIYIIAKLIKTNDISLLRMAKTDVLTGLTNRAGFNEAMERIIQNAKGDENCFAFVIDIDNFKNINDMYGHMTGDKVICQIVKIVMQGLKGNGELFRWGGDEFAGYIFSDKLSLDETLHRIYEDIRSSSDLNKYNASISMGLTPIKNGVSVDSLLKRADKALYQAKESGKNKYIIL